MGGATTTTTTTTLRFFTLLSSPPLQLLHRYHRPSPFLLLRRRLVCHHTSHFSSPSRNTPLLRCSQQFNTQPHQPLWDESRSINSTAFSNPYHPWPEFSGFVSSSGYCNANLLFDDVHHFVDAQQLPHQFLKDASVCLAFARANPTLLWSLPREDIEVIIDNGSPFLFHNAAATMERMKFFRRGGTNDVLESDKPSTIDLMEFLLSYAHLAIGFPENMHGKVESSARKLFSELAKSKGSFVESVATVKKQVSATYGQTPRSFGSEVEMKKGDWICPRCSFMNFAKNFQCLDCGESRPKKFVTGGEWECPQCNFFNFSRNVVCLRCDCNKPELNTYINPSSSSSLRADTSANIHTEEVMAGSEKEQSWFTKIRQLEEKSEISSALEDELIGETSSAYPSTIDDAFVKDDRDSSLTSQYTQQSELSSGFETYGPLSSSQMGNTDFESEQAEKSERWFKKVAELHDVKDLSTATSDEDFPEIMPMQKGENRFVVGKKKDRSLTSPMYKRKAAMEQAGKNNYVNNYVPFVPFPPDYFAKNKPQEGSESTNSETGTISSDFKQSGGQKEDKASNTNFEAPDNADQTQRSLYSNLSSPNEYHSKKHSSNDYESTRDSWRIKSLEGSAVKEPDPLDMSEEAKAERWFRRVAQIKDISELSQIPDEDFPSIMPMRKGVNRFVVSKRKTPLERRLTSSQYQRNLPVENSEPLRNEKDSN